MCDPGEITEEQWQILLATETHKDNFENAVKPKGE
jgi:hypothetical protein